jgi:uncharacterized ferritin-like protein (DUF455 family)
MITAGCKSSIRPTPHQTAHKGKTFPCRNILQLLRRRRPFSENHFDRRVLLQMEATLNSGDHSTGGAQEDQRQDKTLVDWALEILSTADPDEKARLGDLAASLWLRGDIPLPYDPSRPARTPPPGRPARSGAVRLLPPSRGPKLGKGGSTQSRLAMLHSLAHTESWAVDLSWDVVARFGAPARMPREFFDDFARVAQDEGRHYTLLSARLGELGSRYGALPAHDGLWDSATRTSHSLLARLAVEHCVHEVRDNTIFRNTPHRTTTANKAFGLLTTCMEETTPEPNSFFAMAEYFLNSYYILKIMCTMAEYFLNKSY